MRIRLVAVSLMLLAAACGGTDAAVTTSGAPAATSGATGAETTAPGATTPDGTTSEGTDAPDSTANPDSTTSATEALRAEGPIAPTFVTTLSDGSKFDMSTHDRPVYLVFWAEW